MVRAIVFIALLAMGAAVRAAEAVGVPPKTTVMVLPFTMLSDDMENQWIGQAIALILQAELVQEPTLSIVSNISITVPARGPVANPAAMDDQAVMKLAQKAGANLLIVGSYQVVSTEVRATGRVLDIVSGQPVGYIKATASQRQLLELEDMLADQTREVLGLAPAKAGNAVAADEPQYDDRIARAGPARAGAPIEEPEPQVDPGPPYTFVDTYVPSYSYVPAYLTSGYYYGGYSYPYAHRYSYLGWPFCYGYPYYRSYCTPSYVSLAYYYGHNSGYRRPWVDDHPRSSTGADAPRRHPATTINPPRRGGEVVRIHDDPRKGAIGPRRETSDVKRGGDAAKPGRPVEVARANDDAKSTRSTETKRETPVVRRTESDTRHPTRIERPLSPASKGERPTQGPSNTPARIERPIARPSNPPARAERPVERPGSPPPRIERPIERPSSPPPRAERPVERPSNPSASRVERPSPPPQPSGGSRGDSGSSNGRDRR